jgi:alkyl hydroperoxide reductase subunit AhpC
MSLRIGDEAPNFTAETTRGTITCHDWIGNSWAVLISHPKDFTLVCTTELGSMAGLESEFDKRQCKVIGLSVDSVSDEAWARDIEETQGHAAVSEAEAKETFPQGWKSPKPYLRIAPQPQ